MRRQAKKLSGVGFTEEVQGVYIVARGLTQGV